MGGTKDAGCSPKHPVEAHEVWDFNFDTWTQTLTDIIALCPLCHLSIHIGRAQRIGRYEEAVEHIMRVNGWTRNHVEEHIEQVKMECDERSEFSWELDISKFVR